MTLFIENSLFYLPRK
uniref:Uncharacterized protein n=1 Tax=Anguilla anguilla TaxID=7936 RepID=A0A0E9V1X9_ANGAN